MYYYHFPSKEATLEEVVNMMITDEVGKARKILNAPIPVPQKLVGIISALRPEQDESSIANALNRSENIVMHEKVNRRIVDEATPLLAEAVSEGVTQGLFSCGNIEERVRMILVLCQHVFDSGSFSATDIDVFIDIVEKTLGAQPETLGFIRELIN